MADKKRRAAPAKSATGLVGSINERDPGLPVAVIGAGPCGLAAAAALEQSGVRAIVYDRECLASSIAAYPLYMTFFSTAEKISIANVPGRASVEYMVHHGGLQVRTCWREREHSPITAWRTQQHRPRRAQHQAPH